MRKKLKQKILKDESTIDMMLRTFSEKVREASTKYGAGNVATICGVTLRTVQYWNSGDLIPSKPTKVGVWFILDNYEQAANKVTE